MDKIKPIVKNKIKLKGDGYWLSEESIFLIFKNLLVNNVQRGAENSWLNKEALSKEKGPFSLI